MSELTIMELPATPLLFGYIHGTDLPITSFSQITGYTGMGMFFQKCGQVPDEEAVSQLLLALRACEGKEVWTEKEVIELIRRESLQ